MFSSRKLVKAGLAPYYFTGIPCVNGHMARRHTSSGNCCICQEENRKARRQNTTELTRKIRRYEYFKNYAHNKSKIKEWKSKNKQVVNFHTRTRQARKLQATPVWVNLEAIKMIYKNCPSGYEVDHIIPLQGKNVCGLHVPCNLQYLTPLENQIKGNRL